LLVKEEDVKTALDGSWFFQDGSLRNHPRLFCFDCVSRTNFLFLIFCYALCALPLFIEAS